MWSIKKTFLFLTALILLVMGLSVASLVIGPRVVFSQSCTCNYSYCRPQNCTPDNPYSWVRMQSNIKGSCTKNSWCDHPDGDRRCEDCASGYGKIPPNPGATAICVESCGGSCSCGSWSNGGCGAGGCAADQMYQTRNCNPDGCSSESRCVADATCTPPSCTVNLTPDSATVAVGAATTLTASVVIGSGTVTQVDFASGNTGIVTVSPTSDSTVVYSTQASGVSVGSTTVRADVIMSGASRCNDTSTVNVTLPGPWWQVRDADVTSGGDIVSPIPGTCTLPVCNPVFNLKGTGGFPGVTVYGGATADFQAGSGTGTVAEAPYSWLVNTSYSSSKIYDYSFFERQIPSDVAFTEIDTPTYNGGDFNSGGSPARGYVWYHFDGPGDLTITGNVNLTGSRKVVLLVDGADLYITGRINVQSPGNGYFMVVVGKDVNGLKGNIIVDPSVSHPTDPGIEGVYLAEGEFRTGAGTSRLYVRGAVASYGGIVLERDLEGNNDDTPAEYFEYAPDIIATFPQVFTSRRMRWKEVAP